MVTTGRRRARTPDADAISKMVDEQEDRTAQLRQRMEADYDLYRLAEFEAGDGYPSFTGNDPQTYADKVISWMTTATLVVRIPQDNKLEQERQRQDGKERFLIGMLRAADERLLGQLLPPLRDSLAWYIALRGRYAGRSLLVKAEDGSTYVDITPWDPLHTYYGVGPKGLTWACYKVKKTGSEIEEEYEFTPETHVGEEEGIDVYDWYDEQVNAVVIDGRWAKRPQRHYHPRVPVFAGVVGAMPPIQSWSRGRQNTIAEHGESVYQANRKIYEHANFVLSTMLYLVGLAKKRPYTHASPDGTREMEGNPFLEGTEVPILAGQESIDLLPLLEMSRDTGAFLGLIAGMVQRGALPYSIYGELQFALSGFAINTLRQGIDTIIQPRLRALENAYFQICNLVSDQYSDGGFAPMQLNGRGNNRAWFSEWITPEAVRGLGVPEVKLVPNLPQDDQAKLVMAKMAQDIGLPDLWVMDEVLGIQNVDATMDMMLEQMAERMSPVARLYTMMRAAEERGRPELASIYFGELVKAAILNQQPVPGNSTGQPQVSGTFNGRNGIPPEIMPIAAQGVPAPQPVPQQGPLVPSETPRPGAQSVETRLRNIGLYGPGG